MKKRTFILQRNVVLVFAAVLLSIALFTTLIIIGNRNTRQTWQLVNHTYRMSRQAESIHSAIAESESALRGYMLTGKKDWLPQLDSAQSKMKKLSRQALALALDPAQQTRLTELIALIDQKIKYQQSFIAGNTTGQQQFLTYETQSISLNRFVQTLMTEFLQRQDELLLIRSRANENARSRLGASIITGAFLLFLFITIVLARLNKDIRRRKQAEADIKLSEHKFRRLIEDAGVTLFTADCDGLFTYVNERAQQLTGFTQEELLGNSFTNLLLPSWVGQISAIYLQQVRDQSPELMIEFPINTKEGDIKWVEQHSVILYDEKKNHIGYQCVVKDITQKREQEEQLRESEFRFRITLEKLGDNVWEHDMVTGKTYYSQTEYKLLGYQPGDFPPGENIWQQSIHPEDRWMLQESHLRYKQSDTDQHSLEYRVICKDGSEKWVLDRGVVIERSREGDVMRILGTHTDITTIKGAEQEIRESDLKVRAMLESSNDAFYMVSPEGQIMMLNESANRNLRIITGKHAQVGDDMMDFISPERKNIFRAIIKRVLDGNREESEVRLDTREGEKWYHVCYFPVIDEDDTVMAVSISSKDITERKLTERALERIRAEREEYQFRLQSILDNTPLIIFIKDLEGRYLLINRSFREGFQLTDEQVIGKTDFDFDQRNEAGRFKKVDEEVIRTLRSVEVEETITTDEGTRNLLLVKFPLFDKNNNVYGVGGIATDYTHEILHRRKLIDARKKAEMAEQLQEQFLANMSHEIRTPMNGIIGMTNVLMGTELGQQQKEFVHIIKQSSDSLLFLINDILDLSKIKSGKLTLEKTSFDLHDTISSTLATFYIRAREKNIELICEEEEGLPAPLIGDPHRLNQILNNLLGNAMKFTEKGSVQLLVAKEQQAGNTLALRFTIKDTGMGIAPDRLESIFNSFEQANISTTRQFGGTGLGLAITKQLVEMQGGHLEVNSLLGEGTCFSFVIEYAIASEVKATAPVAVQTLQESNLAGKRILVAEDNEVNQKVILHILQKEGIEVTLAGNGREAVTLLENGLQPDLVIMDIQMPEMDGLQTTIYIRNKLNSTVPIIAMTASALRNERTKCFELGMNEYLTKPFVPAELFAHLHKILGTADAPVIVKTEAPAKNTNQYYDLAFLAEMEDAEYTCDVLQTFLDTTPVLIADIKEGTLHENWEQVHRQAHKLKSSVGLLQMTHMLNLLLTIEQNAKTTADTEGLPLLVKKLAEQFALVRPMIEAELQAHRTVNV